jgi:hypothetical protein
MRSTKHINHKLGKRADYINVDWVKFMSKEYLAVIKAINECYRKMLEIGKCKEVFQRVNRSQCELLRAKWKQEFLNAKKKHAVVLQLLREVWCTKIDCIHPC